MGKISDALTNQVVAASQTDKVLGVTGARGDYLSHIVVQPAATSAGTVIVKDNGTAIYTYTSGTLSDLKPFHVVLNQRAELGAAGFTITTGASVAVTAVGSFT